MLSAVEMSRLTMAGSRKDLDEALRMCADLGNVHITAYSGDTDGIDIGTCLLYTSPSPRDRTRSRMPSSA